MFTRPWWQQAFKLLYHTQVIEQQMHNTDSTSVL